MAGLRDIIHGLEHEKGDGEEGGVVDKVLARVPFRRLGVGEGLAGGRGEAGVEGFDPEEVAEVHGGISISS